MEGTEHHPQVPHRVNIWFTPPQGDASKSVYWFCEILAIKYQTLYQGDGQLPDEGYEDSDG